MGQRLFVILYGKCVLTPALLPRQDMVCLPGRGALNGLETLEGCKIGGQDNLDTVERDFQGSYILLSSNVNW